MNEPERRSQWPLIIAAIVLLAAAIAAAILYWPKPDGPDRPEVDVAREQIKLKNRGIAFLEDGEHAAADEVFRQLAEQLPSEPLGRRNLALNRVLAIEALKEIESTPQQLEAAVTAATEAVDKLLEAAPDDPVSHLIAAELAYQADNPRQQVEELETAVRLAPKDPAMQFKLYLSLQYANDEAGIRRAREALGNAAELMPDNIFVQPIWLAVQASAQDKGIQATLARMRKLLEPFAAGIKQRVRFDLLDAIDQSLAAVESGDWPVAVRNAAFLGNVMRPEPMSHIDRRRADPHLLEYVIPDFSEAFYEKAKPPPALAQTGIDVNFVEAGNEQLAAVKGVRDLGLADFNLDGRLDLIVLTEQAVTVWMRDPESEGWQQATVFDAQSGLRGFVPADLDRDTVETPLREKREESPCLDADVDLVIFGDEGLIVLENKLDAASGERTLVPVPQDEVFGSFRMALGAALADIDHDGDLDLVVSSEAGLTIWSNRDDFTFGDISSRSALPPDGFRATKLVPVDWNRDLAIDLVIVDGQSGIAGIMENQLHGRLRWKQLAPEFLARERTTSLDVAELDGNASWDLLSVGGEGLWSSFTTSPRAGVANYLRGRKVEGLTAKSFERLLTFDYDNDGYRDVLAWSGEGATLVGGLPEGRFAEAEDVLDIAQRKLTDVVACDVDDDGDEDLFVGSADGVALYRNDGGNANGWIDVRLSADPDKKPSDASKRVNMHGIGSLLELKTGTSYQAQAVTGRTTHFGLGSLGQAGLLRILWTNGIPENRVDPPRNTAICAKQDLKGSCPYLYTWDGERYAFFTDCLWSSPIGLQFAENILAPAREWEYLKISGDRLREIEGEYRLQITEELWEAAYFDRVKLIAVDHPGDADVYTNEKVGPAEIAKHKIHTVRRPRLPVAAFDKHRRDVLAHIARRDDDYLRAFDGRIIQGLTDEHYIELDLGQLDNPQQITLFLTGWVFPTDTSLNVAISQNPQISPPRPPFIQVPDGNGGWKEAIAYTGFPGGKTKTIAIDISGIFPDDDYRLRLATSMQLCWDHVFFTVDEQPAEVKTTELPLLSANLHYRGFSRRIEHPGHGPESYDYDDADVQPKWPPMSGRFTRYGDVAPLLETEDDQLVVMGAGDEMTLRFRAPAEALPEGWRRDFVLYNVGWDKDADLNTVYGQAVEPLPFRAMRRYPFPVDQPVPDSPEHRRYLERYQTRTQNIARFWKALAR